jgi:hypothetical protein
MFIPDDARLRNFAFGIAEQRRHSLRKPESKEGDELMREEEAEREPPAEDQLSLFSAISAVPLDEQGRPLDASPLEDPGSDGDAAIPGLVGDEESPAEEEADPFTLSAPDFERPVPTPEPDVIPDPSSGTRGSTLSKKRKLREQNSAYVRSLVHRKRMGHAQVNAELNRRVGIKRITEATVGQLEKRLEAARRWIEES